MADVVLRLIGAVVVAASLLRPGSKAWRLDVSTTPRTVEERIGTSVTLFCNIRNTARSTQYLTWVFLDADRADDQLVSSETAVRELYRERFAVSLATIGAGRVRYGLSISRLTTEDDGTYRCQVMDAFTRAAVQYSAVSVSVLFFPESPSCVPSGELFVMAHSLVTLSCASQAGNPTVSMDIERTVNGAAAAPAVPPPAAAGKPPANWTYYENDDTIVRTLTAEISAGYDASSFPCTISAPAPGSLVAGTRSSSCVMGPIHVVPVPPPASAIRLDVEPPSLRVSAGQPAEFSCRVTVSPRAADPAWVQRTWSTVPAIEPERLVVPDPGYAETVRIRAAEMDDDGLVVTCETVIRGLTRRASARLRVVPATRPPPTEPPAATTAATPTPGPPTRTTKTSISLVTRKVPTDPAGTGVTRAPRTGRPTPTLTGTPSPADPAGTAVPTLPTSVSEPWYSKPTGIALIVVVVLFAAAIALGAAYVKRFPRRRLARKVSQRQRSRRYQNVWGSREAKRATMRREASRRQQVTVASTHIYHEARIVPDKAPVDSTVDGLSGMPLVVYAETVVNSLYEADDDRSRTIPCRKSAAGRGNRPVYGNVLGSLTGDAGRHVTLPSNFMIYGDFNLENTNPYESLIGT